MKEYEAAYLKPGLSTKVVEQRDPSPLWSGCSKTRPSKGGSLNDGLCHTRYVLRPRAPLL
jgi:hypothetical protein